MKYFLIEADVPGWVRNSRQDLDNLSELSVIHYTFDCWPDDDIAESNPVYIISEKLSKAIVSAGMTGFILKGCESSKGEQFEIASPGRGDLPPYLWLDVTGTAGVDDFGISENLTLVVSQRVMSILDNFCMKMANISPFE